MRRQLHCLLLLALGTQLRGMKSLPVGRLTASVGIAGINAEGSVNEATAVGLHQKALAALAKAQADGQNQVAVAT